MILQDIVIPPELEGILAWIKWIGYIIAGIAILTIILKIVKQVGETKAAYQQGSKSSTEAQASKVKLQDLQSKIDQALIDQKQKLLEPSTISKLLDSFMKFLKD